MFPEEKGESGFTIRSCAIAMLLTVFLLATSSYIALKIGALPWPIIFSVIVSGALLQFLSRFSRKTNRHEINVAQSGGTIGGLLASGVVFTIPGILYLQQQGTSVSLPDVFTLATVCVTAGVLGVLLSVPVRRVFVEEEDLPYPSGTAGAEVIKAESEVSRSTFYIALALTLSGMFVLARDLFFPAGFAFPIAADAGLVLVLYPMPMAVGIGYILGHKASVNSWFMGSFMGWAILIPLLAVMQGIAPDVGGGMMRDAGMGMVLGAGVGFFASYVIPRAKRIFSPLFRWEGMPWYTRMTPVVSVFAAFALFFAGIPLAAAAIAVVGVWVMVSVAGMMTGETDIDPLEQFGIIIGLLAMGAFAIFSMPLGTLSAFLIVCFVSISAAIAGDIGHDYKSARILGTRAKDIIKADMAAVVVAGLLAPLVLSVIIGAYGTDFFTPLMPAPQAMLVAGSIFGFANPMVFYLGFAISFVWIVIESLTKKRAPVIPMVFGIGLFLGMALGILLAIGGLIRYMTDRKKMNIYASGVILAAGLMGGEGIAGFGSAAMYVAGVPGFISSSFLFGVFAVVLLVAMIFLRKVEE